MTLIKNVKYVMEHKTKIIGPIGLLLIIAITYPFLSKYMQEKFGNIEVPQLNENKKTMTFEEVLLDVSKRPVDIQESRKIEILKKIKVNTSLSDKVKYDTLNSLNTKK